MKEQIGYGFKLPEKECTDRHCPFHGELGIRGRIFIGTIVNDKMKTSPTVEWERSVYVAKYERYKKGRTRVKVHNPPCIDAKLGDKVRIAECRPISKTKNFVIIEKMG
jgi:small subunit ribosomal protein S17